MIHKMPAEQQQLWLNSLDAGRRAQAITAAFCIESAANDTYFWPEAVTATLGQIKGTKNHGWNPNLNHRQGPDGRLMQRIYFDYYLKGSGHPFGTVRIVRVKNLKDERKIITASVHLPAGGMRILFVYTTVWIVQTGCTEPGMDYRWAKRTINTLLPYRSKFRVRKLIFMYG